MEDQRAYYSIKEFSVKLGFHQNTIRRAIKCGRINAFKIGSDKKSSYRIPHSEIDRVSIFSLEKIVETIIEKRQRK